MTRGRPGTSDYTAPRGDQKCCSQIADIFLIADGHAGDISSSILISSIFRDEKLVNYDVLYYSNHK